LNNKRKKNKPFVYFNVDIYLHLFVNKEDRDMYSENLEEDKRMAMERNVGEKGNVSLDLMKKLAKLGY
jgi:hypothetical protein